MILLYLSWFVTAARRICHSYVVLRHLQKKIMVFFFLEGKTWFPLLPFVPFHNPLFHLVALHVGDKPTNSFSFLIHSWGSNRCAEGVKGREGGICLSGFSVAGDADGGGIKTSTRDKRGPYRLTAGKLYVSRVCISILAYFQQPPMKSLPASLPANRQIQR